MLKPLRVSFVGCEKVVYDELRRVGLILIQAIIKTCHFNRNNYVI